MKTKQTKIKEALKTFCYWLVLFTFSGSLLAYGLYRSVCEAQDYVPSYQVPEVTIPHYQKNLKLYNKEEAIERIKEIATQRDFKYTDYLLRLVACETGGTYDQFALNWKNNNGTLDSGILQINSVHKISRDKTFDLDYSVNWAIDMINAGHQSAWVCNKIVLNK